MEALDYGEVDAVFSSRKYWQESTPFIKLGLPNKDRIYKTDNCIGIISGYNDSIDCTQIAEGFIEKFETRILDSTIQRGHHLSRAESFFANRFENARERLIGNTLNRIPNGNDSDATALLAYFYPMPQTEGNAEPVGKVIILNGGESRLYRLRDNELSCLTLDFNNRRSNNIQETRDKWWQGAKNRQDSNAQSVRAPSKRPESTNGLTNRNNSYDIFTEDVNSGDLFLQLSVDVQRIMTGIEIEHICNCDYDPQKIIAAILEEANRRYDAGTTQANDDSYKRSTSANVLQIAGKRTIYEATAKPVRQLQINTTPRSAPRLPLEPARPKTPSSEKGGGLLRGAMALALVAALSLILAKCGVSPSSIGPSLENLTGTITSQMGNGENEYRSTLTPTQPSNASSTPIVGEGVGNILATHDAEATTTTTNEVQSTIITDFVLPGDGWSVIFERNGLDPTSYPSYMLGGRVQVITNGTPIPQDQINIGFIPEPGDEVIISSIEQ